MPLQKMKKEETYWSYSELAEQQNEFVKDVGYGMVTMNLEGMKGLAKHEKFCPHHTADLALNIFQYRSIRNGQIRMIAEREHLEIKNRDC